MDEVDGQQSPRSPMPRDKTPFSPLACPSNLEQMLHDISEKQSRGSKEGSKTGSKAGDKDRSKAGSKAGSVAGSKRSLASKKSPRQSPPSIKIDWSHGVAVPAKP